MTFSKFLPGLALSCSILAIGCGEKPRGDDTHFTKADSVTETYLELKDSMLESWNAMIHDDNQKIKAMKNLLHELKVSDAAHLDEYKILEERVEQLAHSRYTQKSMSNEHVIQEYDFASNSLVSELIAIVEAQTQYGYNTTLQKLVERIRTAEQRIDNYREEYDQIASEYNAFLDQNKVWLKEAEVDSFAKKPLFQMVAKDEEDQE
jgi:hypothetical protein